MSLPARVEVAQVGDNPRVARTLEVAAEAISRAGAELGWLRVPAGLPNDLTADEERTWRAFKATPKPLQESWRVARHLERLIPANGAVLVPDRAGVAGVFALEQAGRPPGERVMVLVAAADSLLLEHEAIAGTHQGLNEEAEAAVDWEVVAYCFAASVLATSERAAELVGGLAGKTQQVTPALEAVGADQAGPRRLVYLPEPVSRLAQTPAILRALAAALEDFPGLRVALSRQDQEDAIWAGTTWEAIAGLREVLGGRVERPRRIRRPNLMILGDPYAVPEGEAEGWYLRGVPALVPAASTAAVRWPRAQGWRDEWHLTDLLLGKAEPMAPSATTPPEVAEPIWSSERARHVSVGVPIFRDVRYLEDCLGSLLAQEQPPHEVILVDDGSGTSEVDTALEEWQSRHPDRIRAIRQENRGVCAARNRALTEMTGDAFVLIDQDDRLAPTFISHCANVLRSDPDLWAVATWTEFFGDYEGIEAKPPFDARVGTRENPIISTCALVDMRVRDLGIRFTPDLAWIFCEDWEFWSKIVAAGGRFGLVPKPLAHHRVHEASGGFRRTPLAYALGKARATAPLLGR